MIELSNLFGLIAVSILLGTLVSCPITNRKYRLYVFFIATFLFNLPIPTIDHSISHFVFAFTDVPSVVTIILALYYWVWKERALKTKTESIAREVWGISVIIFGIFLWLSEMNVIFFDVYRLGYRSSVIFMVSVLALFSLDFKFALLGVLCCCATSLGLYANYWDSILDPFLLIVLLARYIILLVLHFKKKRTLAIYNIDDASVDSDI